MRVEMPLQMHFGNKTARQMICNANLGKESVLEILKILKYISGKRKK
jgi:hypothetical protein